MSDSDDFTLRVDFRDPARSRVWLIEDMRVVGSAFGDSRPPKQVRGARPRGAGRPRVRRVTRRGGSSRGSSNVPPDGDEPARGRRDSRGDA